MGTNYYLRQSCEAPCEHCAVQDIHVGKQSGGWSFGFRGYPHNPDDGDVSPFGFPVESRVDWRRVFAAGVELVDEYGREVSGPSEWLDGLPAPAAEQIAKEDSPAYSGVYNRSDDPSAWRDAEGFRFDETAFE